MSKGVGVVAINGWTFPVDVKQMARRPIQSMRQMQDSGVRNGEQTLDNSALWRRKSDDFVLGQGQSTFDQTEENSQRRQRALSGFDPFTDRRALAVATSMGAGIAAYAGGTLGGTAVFPKLLKTAANWWLIPTVSGTIKRTSSLTNYSTTNVTGLTDATDATVHGTTIYICNGTDVYSGSTSGSSVSLFSTVNTSFIEAVKGRLIGGSGAVLFELDSGGAAIDIFTHPDGGWSWVDFCGGNVGIYCAGHNGLKSEIYLSTLLDATGAIQPPGPVAELPAGELIRSLDFFSGFLVIGTTKGVRVAQATQNGLLNYGPLIELGDVTGTAFEGRFAYVTCPALPTFGGPGVVKLDMTRFTAPYTPGYAGAYPITASGYTPYDVGVADGEVTCVLGNRTNVQMQHTTAGTYGTGYAWTGLITFGVDEPKNVESVSVRFDALTSGQSVQVDLYDKQGGTLKASAIQSQVGATELILTGFSEVLEETAELLLTAVGAVTIRRWTMRAVPAPSRLPEELIVPLMFHREVTADDGTTHSIDGLKAWQFLRDLMKSRTKVTLDFGNESLQVWVDQVGFEGTMEKWDERGRWPEGIVIVRLVTVL